MPTLLMIPVSLDNCFEIGALIVSALTYPRLRGTAFRLFPLFLSFIVLVELTGEYMRVVLHEQNAWLYNISTTVELLFYAYIFRQCLQSETYKRLVSWFVIFYPFIVLINLAFVQGFFNFHS